MASPMPPMQIPPLPPSPPYPGGPAPPFPLEPTQLFGGYPPCNPTAAWYYTPPPTGLVYGLDGRTNSWVPVVTLWQLLCVVQRAVQQYAVLPEAPADGADYVRNGLAKQWVNVQTLDLDGGIYP